MATTIGRALLQAKYAETAETTQYTSADCKTTVELFTASNSTALAATLAVKVVQAGDAAGSVNQVIPPMTIAPGECRTVAGLIGQRLEPGDFISTIAGTASAITIRINGKQTFS